MNQHATPRRPPVDRFSVRRVFNNSAVLVQDASGVEKVLLGKGIGFHRHAGDPVDTASVDKTFALIPNDLARRYLPLIAELTDEEITLLLRILDEADAALGRRVPPSVLLPLADHLGYAVRRARQSEPPLEYDLRWEVRSLYPGEVAFCRRVIALVDEHLGVRLPDAEVTPLALHFATSRLTSPDLGSTMRLTRLLGRILNLVACELGIELDEDSMEVARLVSHLRYLTSGEGHRLAPLSHSVYEAVRLAQPLEYGIAQRVSALLAGEIGRAIKEQEVVFLALHITRLRVATQIKEMTQGGDVRVQED